MGAVALFVHRQRQHAAALAHEAADWLTGHGHEVRVSPADAEAVGLGKYAVEPDQLPAGLDLAVSLGGDGTMLRAVESVIRHGAPVLGVNVGRLGYLAALEPPDLTLGLDRFFSGRYLLEERMTLAVEVQCAEGGSPAAGRHVALNEAVAEKPSAGHTVLVAVEIDGRFFASYAADGLIVATPTGSTAYAFSAGGPIVSSRHRALLLTPVSPHMAFGRSLVLDPEETVALEVIDDRPAMLTVDGRELGLLRRGDRVTCTAGPHCARLVTFAGRDFYGILKAKFGLTDR